MKNIPFKYAVAIVGVIIILIGVIVWQANRGEPTSQTSSVSEQAQQSSAAQPATAAKVTVTTAKTAPVAPVKTNPDTSYTSYTEYVKQLGTAQNVCDNASASQYKALYSGLSGSAYNSFYNPKTGSCYARITGTQIAAYATTTTGYIYFRNVNKNTPVAECVDPTGTLYGDANWKCTNKVTGATIGKAQFDALVASYIAQ
ncbi:MAG: hypothetical protein V4524_01075 [Patescibacteria group bacterium]